MGRARGFHFLPLVSFLGLVGACVAAGPAVRMDDLVLHAFPTAGRVEPIAPEPKCPRQCNMSTVYGTGGEVLGYTVMQRLTGRSGRFTIVIFVSSGFRVVSAEVLTYDGERGSEVRSEHFTRQFAGKAAGDPLQIGKDIDAVSGATISCSAMADGVRHALRLLRDRFAE